MESNALVTGFPKWAYVGKIWELCKNVEPLWWGECGDIVF